MAEKIASGWNINSTVLWIIVVQSVFIAVVLSVIIALLVHRAKVKKRERQQRESAPYEYGYMPVRPYNADGIPSNVVVYTSPEYGNAIHDYVNNVVKTSMQWPGSPFGQGNGPSTFGSFPPEPPEPPKK